MRLYLSSYRFGDHFNALVGMAGLGARAGVISNALDFIPEQARLDYARTIHDPLEDLRRAGMHAADLDLRRYFGQPARLEQALGELDLVWAVGGNAFLLRRAMRQSGFDRVIGSLVGEDRLIYGGWSAGAVVAGPSLHGIELMDDPGVVAEGYDSPPVWAGLGLIDLCIVPHVRSDHPEAAAAKQVVALMTQDHVAFQPLSDGEVIIADGLDWALRPAG